MATYEIEVDGETYEVDSPKEMSGDELRFYAQKLRKPAPQPAQGPSPMQSIFPNATAQYQTRQMPVSFSPGGAGFPGPMQESGSVDISPREQQMLAVPDDVMGFGTRFAGAAAANPREAIQLIPGGPVFNAALGAVGMGPMVDAVGYSGATGGKRGMAEGLADPETGLMRPARERLGGALAEDIANPYKTPWTYGKMGLEGLGLFGAGMVEDPAVIASMGETAPKAFAKITPKPAKWAAAAKADKLGERIQKNAIRPVGMGLEKSDELIASAKRYGVTGDADQVLSGSEAKIREASDKLQAAIQKGADRGAAINLRWAIGEVKNELKADPESFKGGLHEAYQALKYWDRDAQLAEPSGKLNLLRAQKYKQKMGIAGSWNDYAKSKGSPINPEDDAKSQIASMIYLKLRDKINAAAKSPDVRDANKVLSDLIPVRDAAAHRKLVSDRNNVIPLSDYLGAISSIGTGGAALPAWALMRAAKSGKSATALFEIAKKLRGSPTMAEQSFYGNQLRRIGFTAAEVEALRAGQDLAQEMPYSRAAKREQKPNQDSTTTLAGAP